MICVTIVLLAMLVVVAAIRLLVAVDRFFTARRRARSKQLALRRSGHPGGAQGDQIDPRWALQVVAAAAQEWRRIEPGQP